MSLHQLLVERDYQAKGDVGKWGEMLIVGGRKVQTTLKVWESAALFLTATRRLHELVSPNPKFLHADTLSLS